MVELDEIQLAIYNYSSEHTLKETCEHFQKENIKLNTLNTTIMKG